MTARRALPSESGPPEALFFQSGSTGGSGANPIRWRCLTGEFIKHSVPRELFSGLTRTLDDSDASVPKSAQTQRICRVAPKGFLSPRCGDYGQALS